MTVPDVGVGWPDNLASPGTALGWPDAPVSRETADADPIPHSTATQPASAPSPSSVAQESAPLQAPTPVPAEVIRPLKTRVLTVANQKGGVGKTTTAVNLAAALAMQGLVVLCIDLDPQGNASTALGIDHHSDVASVYDVLVDGRPLSDVVQPVEAIDGLLCAPATIDLAGAEIELVPLVARESRLRKALAGYVGYRQREALPRLDMVLIDSPPSLGLLTVNALVAAEEVLIPIQCEYYALEGLGQLLKNVEMVREHLNPALHVSTILLTMYDARTRLASQVADEVRTHFPEQVLATAVPRSIRVSEAPSYGQTVLTYDPASSGALAYLHAAREVALRGAPSREPAADAIDIRDAVDVREPGPVPGAGSAAGGDGAAVFGGFPGGASLQKEMDA